MKKTLLLSSFALLLWACGGGEHKPVDPTTDNVPAEGSAPAQDNTSASGGANANAKGFGKFDKVDLPDKLDPAMAKKGEDVYKMKCASCHRTDDKKLVGPGWAGVTKRRTPEWIMNFVTNVDENLEKDEASKQMLEECLVRMPNQNLSDDDARNTLEYMRQIDGVK